jgi:hypothetical protein
MEKPVENISGRTRRSAPASFACSAKRLALMWFASRSCHTMSICTAAIFITPTPLLRQDHKIDRISESPTLRIQNHVDPVIRSNLLFDMVTGFRKPAKAR